MDGFDAGSRNECGGRSSERLRGRCEQRAVEISVVAGETNGIDAESSGLEQLAGRNFSDHGGETISLMTHSGCDFIDS